MPKSIKALTKDDIDGELNKDSTDSGGEEDQDHLNKMDLEEKKNLLRGIKQSKDFQRDISPKSPNQPRIDISNYNTLNISQKNNIVAHSKHKQPWKVKDSKSSENTLCQIDDEPNSTRFTLPFCVNDGAPCLPPLNRPLLYVESPYYVKLGETPGAALQRMLAHHDRWKQQYQAEINRMESHALEEDVEQKGSPRSENGEEKENDIFQFNPDSPVQTSSKIYTNSRKKEADKISDNVLQSGSHSLQRKPSRDSDCEEVEPMLTPENPKLSDFTVASRSKGKRNKKQMLNHEKTQSEGSQTCVDFEFDNKWNPNLSSWHGSQSPGPSNLKTQTPVRRPLSSTPVIEEGKVQCPICQQNFAQSKVETHAARCEVYSEPGSPMDVEEEI